jgi:hypothetical protein
MATTALELRHLETLLALGRVRQSIQGGRAPVSDSVRPVAPAQGTGKPLWRRPGRKKCAATALYGHRPALGGPRPHVLPQVAEAGRDVARLAQGHAGPLRVAVQCHNCFDWLMPAMDAYRSLWPEVELDIISGFVVDPLPLLERGEAELAIIHDAQEARTQRRIQPLVPLRERGADEPAASARRQALARGRRFRRRNPHHLPGTRRDAGRHEALPHARPASIRSGAPPNSPSPFCSWSPAAEALPPYPHGPWATTSSAATWSRGPSVHTAYAASCTPPPRPSPPRPPI